MRGDAEAIAREMAMIWQDGSIYELRILGTRSATISGYYDNLALFARDAAAWDGKAAGIYVTLNPVKSALLARAANHVRERAKATTADHDIERRCWLPLDFDPVRPADVSSSDDEHAEAEAHARRCARWLIAEGVPQSSLLLADSGNGAHLLWRVDLPNDETAKELVRRCTEAASLRFSDEVVAVDLKTFNASRIWKVYGTHACKGDNLEDRPHRQARVILVGS